MSTSLDFVSHADYLVALLPAWLLSLAALGILMGTLFPRTTTAKRADAGSDP